MRLIAFGSPDRRITPLARSALIAGAYQWKRNGCPTSPLARSAREIANTRRKTRHMRRITRGGSKYPSTHVRYAPRARPRARSILLILPLHLLFLSSPLPPPLSLSLSLSRATPCSCTNKLPRADRIFYTRSLAYSQTSVHVYACSRMCVAACAIYRFRGRV